MNILRSRIYNNIELYYIHTCIYDFIKHLNEMKSWFLNREYPKTLVDTEVNKVKFPNTSGDKKN